MLVTRIIVVYVDKEPALFGMFATTTTTMVSFIQICVWPIALQTREYLKVETKRETDRSYEERTGRERETVVLDEASPNALVLFVYRIEKKGGVLEKFGGKEELKRKRKTMGF